MSDTFIRQGKLAELTKRMAGLGIREEELLEKFIKGSGKGGQKVNKTASCVYLKHLPSGMEVKCQQERSLAMNRFFARRELCDRLEEKVKGEASARRREMERIRRQKRRRSRRQKDRMLQDKHHHSAKKTSRGKPAGDE